MASYQRRSRPAAAVQDRAQEYDEEDVDTTTQHDSVDSAVLLFRGQPPRAAHAARSISPASSSLFDSGQEDQSWDVVPQERTLSPESCSSATTSSSSRDPSGQQRRRRRGQQQLSHSLFPSHDGNGIFVQDSLVQSSEGPPTTFAATDSSDLDSNQVGEGHLTSMSDESEDYRLSSMDSAASSVAESDDVVVRRRGRAAAATTTAISSSTGGSWALTEAALSTIPDAAPILINGIPHVHEAGPSSVDFTSSSSEDESLGAAGSRVTPKGQRRPPRQAARRRASRATATESPEQEEEEDEDVLSTTPKAAAGGLLSRMAVAADKTGQWRRQAYPSPPPEEDSVLLRQSKARGKRRHRQSGRGPGSQKRSSTSGSISGGAAGNRALLAPSLAAMAQQLRDEIEVTQRRFETPQQLENRLRREHAQRQIPLGELVGARVFGVDTDTLQMLATPEATPTPSRAASPSPLAAIPSTPKSRSHDPAPHGLHALAQHARDELGDSSMFYFDHDEARDSGDDTETEASPATTWIDSSSSAPLVFAPRRNTVTALPVTASDAEQEEDLTIGAEDEKEEQQHSRVTRTFSASSLPAYLSRASRAQPTKEVLEVAGSHHEAAAAAAGPVKALRRTASYESSAAGSSSTSPLGSYSPSDENAWGGEFEGFEAAMSYWRKLLKRLRGH